MDEEEEESEYAPSGSDGGESETDESELSGETEESEEDSGRWLTVITCRHLFLSDFVWPFEMRMNCLVRKL